MVFDQFCFSVNFNNMSWNKSSGKRQVHLDLWHSYSIREGIFTPKNWKYEEIGKRMPDKIEKEYESQ